MKKDLNKQPNHCAFTLAEVLITLGIIGIVAAMTLPTLIANYQKHITETGLKTAYAILSEALNLSVVDNGELKDWLYFNPNLSVSENSWNFTNTYLAPYLKKAALYKSDKLNNCPNITYRTPNGNIQPCTSVVGFCDNCSSSQSSSMTQIHLANGIIYTVMTRSFMPAEFDVDINGYKGPNVWGKDIFRFFLSADSYKLKGSFSPNDKRQYYLRECTDSETKISGCSALIMIDGWKIKDDYPW